MYTMMRFTDTDGTVRVVPYRLGAMCYVILNELDYELEGRDY